MSEIKEPLFSIVLPVCGECNCLDSAIKSCLSQSYSQFELIIVQIGENEDIHKSIQQYHDDRIRYLKSDRRNGIALGAELIWILSNSRSGYVKLMFPTDILYEDCLENIDNCLKADNVDFCISDMSYANEFRYDLNYTWKQRYIHCDYDNIESYLLKNFIRQIDIYPLASVCFKREILNQCKIDVTNVETLWASLFTQCLIRGFRLGFINKVLVKSSRHTIYDDNIKDEALKARQIYFEWFKLYELFYEIKNIDMICEIFNDDFSFIITENDKDLIPFVVAHFYLTMNYHSHDCPRGYDICRFAGWKKINTFIHDDVIRNRLEDVFHYGIKEFREDYSRMPYENYCVIKEPHYKNAVEKFRKTAKNTVGDYLSCRQAFYLILRKIWRIITFRELHK